MKKGGPGDGLVAVEDVYPEVDCGRFPVKRVVGDVLEIWADVFKPGHDKVAASIQYRLPRGRAWLEVPMSHFDNDRWVGRLPLDSLGSYSYRVSAWTDRFGTVLQGVEKWHAAGEEVGMDLKTLAGLVSEAAARANASERARLAEYAGKIGGSKSSDDALAAAEERELLDLMRANAPRRESSSSPELAAVVDREKASFAAWYEMFPRSQGRDPGRGATFAECERRLRDVSSMGFDVLYLPPIHPIGRTNRRGPNNTPDAGPGAPGSPWAIGSEDGGHDAVDPELGTMADFEHFLSAAGDAGLEVALDLAFQCSPDHPYVQEHPEWFYHREDGSIRYAENPPKKYYDIVPLDFDGPGWRELWEELKRVTLFWVKKGVKTFRVDNPHTKPTTFWEWLIGEVKREHPEVLFLAEAFTAPKPMRKLSKLGFSQSYTYFTWKNTKAELQQFLREFVLSDVAQYYRGNFFTNTPDILHAYLQKGGRPAFKVRLALAATLSSLYGIYSGYELCENVAKEEGSEEYAESEKYQYKVRDWDAPGNIKDYISKVNSIRRGNEALHRTANLRLLPADDDRVIFYAKWNPAKSNVIAVAANLDPHARSQSAVRMPLAELGIGPDEPYGMTELISGESYEWRGEARTVILDPEVEPVQVFRVERTR